MGFAFDRRDPWLFLNVTELEHPVKGGILGYPTPVLVKRVNPVQTDVTWNDGHFSSFPSWYLREKCPCANCVDEFSGKRRVLPGSVPASLERTGVQAVGNYALSFSWSDGHSTGIYTFDYLREICPCRECLPEGLEAPPEANLDSGSFEA
jgi:DUF971 family protein